MQPYIFPYLGYFQLISVVDKFVIYDDVAFIKQGWINRNRILLNGLPHLFTIPLEDASSFRAINEIKLDKRSYGSWKQKFLKTITQSYRKAPQYDAVFTLIEEVSSAEENETVSTLATRSITSVCNYLEIDTSIVPTSEVYGNESLAGQDRIIDLCQKEQADEYVNAIGGQSLYFSDDFAEKNLQLRFIEGLNPPYRQFNHGFVSSLSIIDVLMFNTVTETKLLLNDYKLLSK